MPRYYKDRDGVVHEASDLGLEYGNKITLCEREADCDMYDSRELQLTTEPVSCLVCFHAPDWRRKMTNP